MTIKTSFDMVITFDLERSDNAHYADAYLENSDVDDEGWLDDSIDSFWCSNSDDESSILSYLSEDEEIMLPLSRVQSSGRKHGRRNRRRSETASEESGALTRQSRRDARNPWSLDDDDDDSITLARDRGLWHALDSATDEIYLTDSLRLARSRIPLLERNLTRREGAEAEDMGRSEANESLSVAEGEFDFVLPVDPISTLSTPGISKESNKGLRC